MIAAADALKTPFERGADLRQLEHDLDGLIAAHWADTTDRLEVAAVEFNEDMRQLDNLAGAITRAGRALSGLTANNIAANCPSLAAHGPATREGPPVVMSDPLPQAPGRVDRGACALADRSQLRDEAARDHRTTRMALLELRQAGAQCAATRFGSVVAIHEHDHPAVAHECTPRA